MAQVSAVGIPPEKTVLVGFSQGACLALEYAVRHPQRYGALVGLSGGLIGADDELTGYEGSLDGTPVLLGCSDVDFHIPLKRVNESARLLSALGANVDERIYPNFGHSINDDEINAMVRLIEAL
jgi:predicted esterase